MTPQEQAMADLLQVSLFKLGDQYHETIAKVRKRAPDKAAELDAIAKGVEEMIDETLKDFAENGADFDMQAIDIIHSQIVGLKHVEDL